MSSLFDLITTSEYELADFVISAQRTLTPVISLMITVLTGYLIVAWLAGDKLTWRLNELEIWK